jgi:hypothetical protein
MDRRSFVQRGLVGASGMAAAGKPILVSAAQTGGSPLYPLDDYLARMDAGLQRVREWSILDALPDYGGDAGMVDDLGRKAFTSLYMTAMFTDLPLEEQIRPEVQSRLWAVQSTMDAAMDDMTAYLRSRTKEDLTAVQRAIREDPAALDRVAEMIDVEAARTGISDERRRSTRRMIEHLGWRMANQPPSLLVDEYLQKIEKIETSNVEDAARQRWLASKLGEEAFWAAAQEEQSLRQRRLSRGLRNMGIGAVLFLGGYLLATSSDGDSAGVGAITGTVGAIWFLVGLIQLLMGAGTSPSA